MGTEDPSEEIGKKMKRRLSVRGYYCRLWPSLFEMDDFIYECADAFLDGAHRPPINLLQKMLKRTVNVLLAKLWIGLL